MGRSDIAELLDVSTHTAAGHTKSIYRKLNVSGRVEAELEAVKMGTMLVSLLALMTYFPRQFTRHSPAKITVPIAVLLQANEWLQWYEWPLHTHYLPIFMLYLTGVLVAIHQWRLSRQNPIDRVDVQMEEPGTYPFSVDNQSLTIIT